MLRNDASPLCAVGLACASLLLGCDEAARREHPGVKESASVLASCSALLVGADVVGRDLVLELQSYLQPPPTKREALCFAAAVTAISRSEHVSGKLPPLRTRIDEYQQRGGITSDELASMIYPRFCCSTRF